MKSAIVATALLLLPSAALAQGPVAPISVEPMPWLMVDVRIAWPGIGQDELTATGVGAPATDLPNRALTGVAGIHAYPIRRGRWKLGIGAEMLMGRGRFQKKTTDGEPVGEVITRTLESITAQASLNFGRGQGWSYVTVGSGPFAFDSFRGAGPGDGAAKSTWNVGGGARWFKWRHAGFTTDLRFYFTRGAAGTTITAPRGGQKIVVLSAGISIK